MKRLFAGLLALCLLAGCQSGAVQSESGGAAETESAAQETPVEITDTETLSALWRNDLYYGFLDIQREFSAAAELNATDTARIAYRNFLEYGDTALLRTVTVPEAQWDTVNDPLRGAPGYALTAEQMAAEIERCFDIKIDDPRAYFADAVFRNYEGPHYIPATGDVAFMANTVEGMREDGFVEYPEHAWFDLYLESAWQYADGHIEARLPHGTQIGGETVRFADYTFSLIPGGEGGWRLQSCRIDYLPLALYTFDGRYAAADALNDALPQNSDDIRYSYRMIGEHAGSFYLCAVEEARSEADACAVTIVRVDSATRAVTARLETTAVLKPETYGCYDLSIDTTDTGIRLCDAAAVTDCDWALNETAKTPLPDFVRERMVRVYNAAENRYARLFVGYAVSADLSAWYCSNEEGLWRYDAAGSNALLVPAQSGTGKLMEGATIVPQNLRLVNGDRTLYYTIPGYEHIAGFCLLDTATGTTTALTAPEGRQDGYLDAVLCTKTGLVMLEAVYPNAGDSYCNLWYRSFDGEDARRLTTEPYPGSILPGDGCLALTTGGKTDTLTATVYDLATGAGRGAGWTMTCKNGDSGSYLGVLSDGRILYRYNENPKEPHWMLLG